ncbi:MAG: hypothetical protein ACR2O0_00440 [Rhizobiaceae bacterium]
MRNIAIFIATMFFVSPALAGDAAVSKTAPLIMAQLVTGTPQQKLQKLLRPHAYYGGRITDDIRAATGNPNIPVIDRRGTWGEIYSCNYVFMRGNQQGRTLVCG